MVPGVDQPLVSVVTPTWQRHDILLNRCIPSVAAQDYGGRVEHVIVSDGPDPILREKFTSGHVMWNGRFEEMSDHDPAVPWGTRARLHGIDLAKGDLIAYLDDDNDYWPQMLEKTCGALLADGTDFAYCQELWVNHGHRVGADPPVFGQIDTSVIVHRRELLDTATWRYEPGQQTIDWDLVERWLRAGATWSFVPEVLVNYHGPGNP